MAFAFDIVPTTTSAKLDASGKGQLEFTVTNALKRDVRVRVRVIPEGQSRAEWLKLDATEKDLKADGTAKFAVAVAAPREAAAGDYAFHIVVASVAKPDDEFANGPSVSFSVSQPPPDGKKPFPWWIPVVAGAVLLVGGGVTWFLLRDGGKPGDPCDDKGRCPGEMACVSQGGAKVCLVEVGKECKAAKDCRTGVCENGKCAPVPVGTPCGPGKAACAPNQKCVPVGAGAYCLVAPKQPCSRDLECSSQWCDTRVTPNVCARDDGHCDVNNDCRAGFACAAAVCRKVNGQACAAAEECASGHCVNGSCSACATPCPSGYVGCPPTCVPRKVVAPDVIRVDPRLEYRLRDLNAPRTPTR